MIEHLDLILQIESCDGFIQQQHRRILSQRAGQNHSSPFSTGQLIDLPLAKCVQAGGLDRFVNPLVIDKRHRQPPTAMRHSSKRDNVDDSQGRIAIFKLRHQRNPLRQRAPRPFHDVVFVKRNRSGARLQVSGQQLQQRRFARSVGPNKRHDFTGNQFDFYPIDNQARIKAKLQGPCL